MHLNEIQNLLKKLSRWALKIVIGSREQGTGNGEQGTGNTEESFE
jgi:hypothetical protein